MLIAGIVNSGAGVMKEGDGRVSIVGFYVMKWREKQLKAAVCDAKFICDLAFNKISGLVTRASQLAPTLDSRSLRSRLRWSKEKLGRSNAGKATIDRT